MTTIGPYETLLTELEGSVALVTMNRPKKLNALNRQVLTELDDALCVLSAAQRDVRVVILTGSGAKAFVAGADIGEMTALSSQQARAFSTFGQGVFRRLEEARFATIAAVNGFALGGGCELALACDMIYAAESAQFGQPEIDLGLMPGFGGTFRLAERIGPGRAKEWLFTGGRSAAREAHALGLVDRVFPDADLLSETRALAARIAGKAPLALAACKRVGSLAPKLDRGSAGALEAEAFGALFASEDAKEGVRAFLEQRKPAFQNR